MKSQKRTFLMAMLACLHVMGQEPGKIKFGKVSAEELWMTSYPKDTTCGAVVLYDYCNIYFDHNPGDHQMRMVSEYHLRVKVFNKSALDLATRKIDYLKFYGGKEIVTKIKGYSHNLENGKIVSTKLEEGSIFDVQVNGRHFQKKISMPNVRPGSIFEILYVVESPVAVRLTPRKWYFQSSLPVAWSEFNLQAPEYFHFKTHFTGYQPLYINSAEPASWLLGDQMVMGTKIKFVMRDIPPFKAEPFLSGAEDYVSSVTFELASLFLPGEKPRNYSETWENIGSGLMKNEAFENEGGRISPRGLQRVG